MLIVVAYDISVKDQKGAKRLARVAKICSRYGQRVQNSVFECLIDQLTFVKLKTELTKAIVEKTDSLRFYNLGDHYKNKVTHIGTKEVLDLTDGLIF